MKASIGRACGAFLLALLCAVAQAATGFAVFAGLDGDGPVTLFYPAQGEPQAVRSGPFTIQAVRDGMPVRGNGRLAVISHGSGGSAWVHADLAFALVEAGFVVAAPEHRGDNYKSRGDAGPVSWQRRPAEVSRAIDAVAGDARFATLLSTDKVGVYGMSAGGHTALSMAGGRWSPAGLPRHCEANIRQDFPACVGLATQLNGDWLDGTKIRTALWLLRWRFTDAGPQTHADVRVRAVVAAVPYAADFDMSSFSKTGVPLGLVRAGGDKWLAPRFHSDAVLRACRTCVLVADLPTAGHGALLSPLPPGLTGAVAALLNDPPGFDRKGLLPPVDRAIVEFFRKHLLP